MENRTNLMVIKGHSARVYCLVLTKDSTLISGSDDLTVKFWDVDTGHCKGTIFTYGMVFGLEVISNELLIVGTNNVIDNIHVYDIRKNKIVRRFRGHTRYVGYLLKMPNNRLASASGDRTIKIWKI